MAAIAVTTTAATKTCKRCGQNKSLQDFNTHKKTRDHREGSCKLCRNARFKLQYISTHRNDPRRKDFKPEPLIQKEWKMGDPWFIFDN